MTHTFEILMVEDEEFARETQISYLNKEIEDGKPVFNVTSAGDFESALSMLEENTFDGVILDLRLPERRGKGAESETGAKLLEVMNANEATRDAAIVVLTAYATVERAAHLTRRGACEFIQKPVDPVYLVHILRLAIERKKLRRRVDELTIESIKASTSDIILHDVNNDLNDIVGEAEYVRDDLLSKKPETQWTPEFRERMDRIIDMAIRASQRAVSVMHQRDLVRGEVDICETLKRHLEHLREDYRKKGISIGVPLDESVPPIESYPEIVIQALYPLIENAFEAAPPDGVIEFSTSYDAQEKIAEVRISDSGPGMDEEQIRRALSGGYSTKGGRRGFGLFVSRRLLHELGGGLQVESEKGKGTTVIVSIPSLEDLII